MPRVPGEEIRGHNPVVFHLELSTLHTTAPLNQPTHPVKNTVPAALQFDVLSVRSSREKTFFAAGGFGAYAASRGTSCSIHQCVRVGAARSASAEPQTLHGSGPSPPSTDAMLHKHSINLLSESTLCTQNFMRPKRKRTQPQPRVSTCGC